MSKLKVLITGGSGYIGKEIVSRLTDDGVEVFLFDGNISDESSVNQFVSSFIKENNSVDVVIHCASAPLVRKQLSELSTDDFNKQFNVNVFGLFYLYKSIHKYINPNGLILGILSQSIYRDWAGNSGSYIPAKFGLAGLLHQIQIEVAPLNIRVDAIAPAFIPGGLNSDIPENVMNLLVNKMPGDELATKEQVASTVLEIIKNPEKFPTGKVALVPSLEVRNI